ncbi:hypothetical protein Vretimale_12299 [Volvox reticuliferus]|uniref:Uncharacterized protein n=1 Tax=Volvox reticuliferus TaxID=1737510 RepID=A0A8J4LSJ8_9CHLO|nr:hypothetical protein Vretifemale_8914 [Volvox reticuliferus]GIM08216.1 hypothetical protein Vretimale_12299 [Volvox reticuliferus]
MAKRSAETFAGHESVPTGALPFFVSNAKRVRCSWGSRAPPSPSDPISYYYQANSSSSDDMNDAGATEQADAVSAHHLTTAPSCSSTAWPGGATFHILGSMECLNALGVQPPPHCPFARQFLEQLASCLLGCQLASHGGLSGGSAVAANLGTAFWHAFAELNVLLARHFAELPTSMLRGYHSFTRAPRGQLWQRFLASQGAEMCEGMHVGLPGWLAMTRFLLEYVLAAHPTASCVVYTIEVPPWLRTWCARWNHPGNAPLRVLAVFAYEAVGTPSPRALYVPCVEFAGC